MKKIRVGLETSITRFVRTGLGVYASNLANALQNLNTDITIVPCTIPPVMAQAPHPIVQKVFAAYWQIVHARLIVPYIARRQQCDLVHYTMSMPIPEHMPCPTVATIHDLIPLLYPEWVPPVRGQRMRRGLELAMERADHVITDSETTRRDTLTHSKRSVESVTAIWLGADTQLPDLGEDEASTLVQHQFHLQPGYILCVGSIEPRKNLAQVLQAYRLIRQTPLHQPKLVIVGGNVWKHNQFQRQIDQLGLQEHIICTGHVTDRQLAALFRSAGVFVYPSLYEGFGFPPLEAMRAGCPVVTSNASSLPEVVGDAAITVDPNNTRQIATAIHEVLTDPALAADLRKRGASHVQYFTWQRCAEETVAVYQKVLG